MGTFRGCLLYNHGLCWNSYRGAICAVKKTNRPALGLLIAEVFACLLCGLVFVPGLRAQAVLTWHDDAGRTGQYLQETLLSPSNVNSTNFGLITTVALDGKVDAEPLYVPALSIKGGTHNVLYVVTENDTLYAIDADAGGTPFWSYSAIPSGENVSDSDNGCGQIGPEVGITSTPAIDLTQGPNGTIYFVAMTKKSTTYYQRLHAVDLIAGTEQSGWPITIAATYPSTGPNSSGGKVTFVPQQYKERAALLISNGVIYTTWASNCDSGVYNGWVIGYNESTQAQTVLNLTPNGTEGAIWMAGAGPAVDAGGNLYFLMANGTFDTTLNANGFPSKGDYGNAFMNLSTTDGLAVADYFTMHNTVSESSGDVDFGSGGELLLPVLNDAMGNPHELAVGAGKDGTGYVVDRNNMGKYNGTTNVVYQQIPLDSAVFSSPAWFNNTLYYGPIGSPITAYTYSGGSFNTSSPPSTSHSFGAGDNNTGATPSISANPSVGSQTGIVWAADTTSSGAAQLYAFNASTLSELYDSTQAGSRDSFGDGVTFPIAMVANGKVYVGTTTSVAIFGLLNCVYIVTPETNTTIDVSTSAGCSWSAVSESDFITITSGASGTGNGTVTIQFPAFEGSSRVGLISVAGQLLALQQSGNSTLGAPSSPAPASGSEGVSINPTLTWTAATGATSYDVYFGTSPTPPMVTSTASTSYTPGTLDPGITYYWMVVATNSSGTNSSPIWSFITTNATAVSVTPSSGAGLSQTFALKYSDTAGANNLQSVAVSFNTMIAGNATNSCVLTYDITTNQVSLLNDGNTGSTSATPGASGTLSNSQCSLNVPGTSVATSGNTLTLNLPMTFQEAYAGVKNVYLYAADISGANNGWQQLGKWTGNPLGDFNLAGHTDLLWQNTSAGLVYIWYLGGAQGDVYQSSAGMAAPAGWNLVGAADLNLDGYPDLIWQNATTGQALVWYMGGAGGNVYQSFGWLNSGDLPGWTLVAAVDLNGDGHPDLIWRNNSTGQVAAWYMGGAGGNIYQSFGWLNSGNLSGWTLVGVADFNGDGHPDLMWQSNTTGQVAVWYMGGAQGNVYQSFGWLNSGNLSGWTVVGAADLNLDGHPDLIWQDTTGQVAVWYMGGPQGNVYQSFAWIASGNMSGWTAIARY
jgi:hypothetical protein